MLPKQSTGLFGKSGSTKTTCRLWGKTLERYPKRTLIDFPNKSVINIHQHCICYAITLVNNDFFNQQVNQLFRKLRNVGVSPNQFREFLGIFGEQLGLTQLFGNLYKSFLDLRALSLNTTA